MHQTRLLSELIQEYCVVLQTEKPADEGTQKRYRDPLDTMLRLLGDREISGYSSQDLVVLKAKLYRWPANVANLAEFSGKTTEEILRMNAARTLDKRTVDSKYMEKISAVFQYAFRHGLIAVDIARNVVKTVTVAEKKASRRKPYDIEDLKKIFGSLPVHPERPHLAWVPLIAAYSGARQGEICRLKLSDINGDYRTPYMVVTEEDDNGTVVRNLRGETSQRLVPLHPLLVEIGLLQFIAMRKARGRELLFELRPKGGDEPTPLSGEYYGQSFETFNRKHVTHDLRKGFQSFRYNVHHALTLKKVLPELCFAITGHVPQYDSEQTLSDKKRLEDKYNALAQLTYPGLDLAGLKEKLVLLNR
jgi:integrase